MSEGVADKVRRASGTLYVLAYVLASLEEDQLVGGDVPAAETRRLAEDLEDIAKGLESLRRSL